MSDNETHITEGKTDAQSVVELNLLSQVVSQFVAPFSENQSLKIKEDAKIAARKAKTIDRAILLLFFISVGVIAIIIFSIYLNKDSLAENILFGLFGFLGGIGVSKFGNGGS